MESLPDYREWLVQALIPLLIGVLARVTLKKFWEFLLDWLSTKPPTRHRQFQSFHSVLLPTICLYPPPPESSCSHSQLPRVQQQNLLHFTFPGRSMHTLKTLSLFNFSRFGDWSIIFIDLTVNIHLWVNTMFFILGLVYLTQVEFFSAFKFPDVIIS